MVTPLPAGTRECSNCIYDWRDVLKRKYEEDPVSVNVNELLDHHEKDCSHKRPKVRA